MKSAAFALVRHGAIQHRQRNSLAVGALELHHLRDHLDEQCAIRGVELFKRDGESVALDQAVAGRPPLS